MSNDRTPKDGDPYEWHKDHDVVQTAVGSQGDLKKYWYCRDCKVEVIKEVATIINFDEVKEEISNFIYTFCPNPAVNEELDKCAEMYGFARKDKESDEDFKKRIRKDMM